MTANVLVVRYADFAQRLTTLMAADGSAIPSVTALKNTLEVTYEMARRYTLGQAKPRDGKLTLLAEALGTTPAYLDHGEAPSPTISLATTPPQITDTTSPPLDGRIWLEVYDISRLMSLDTALPPAQRFRHLPAQALPLAADIFTRHRVDPASAMLAYADNDSMSPYLNSGDLYGIDLSDQTIRDGGIYAFYFDDQAMVKQIFKEGGGKLRLHAHNSSYPDKYVTADNQDAFVLIGRQFYRAG